MAAGFGRPPTAVRPSYFPQSRHHASRAGADEPQPGAGLRRSMSVPSRRSETTGREPGGDAASRFTTALHRGPADPAQALPSHLQPLARAIVGSRRVTLRTGPSARRALAAAGKQAATVGGVIHLRRAPDRTARSAEVLAHELVHAAHPSPRPRFLDDDRHSHEESLARRTGSLVRALVAPQPAPGLARGTQGLAVGAAGGVMNALSHDPNHRSNTSIQRSLASASSLPKGKGSHMPESSLVQHTAELFRQASVPATVGSHAVVRRQADPDHPQPGDPPIIRRASWSGGVQPTPEVVATPVGGPDYMESLEQQVIDELERRGLRHDLGVF